MLYWVYKLQKRKDATYGIACTPIFPCRCKRTEHCKGSRIPAFVAIHAVRFIAKAARALYKTYPGIHYHIASGNTGFVLERLDKGPIDFGIVFGSVDTKKYNSIPLPSKDTWGILMRKSGNSILCFRPLSPKKEEGMSIVWKKYQIFSKASEKFMEKLKGLPTQI